jgi:ComF family protein
VIKFLQVRSWPVWDLLYPPTCENCGEPLQEGSILFCAACWSEIQIVESDDMPAFKYVDHAFSAFAFSGDNLVRQLVHSLKYDAQVELASEMARRMLLRIPLHFLNPDVEFSAVPQHWQRRIERSFNQSQMLAVQLSVQSRRDVPLKILRRVRNTPTQTRRTLTERRENVKDAFSIGRNIAVPKKVLLIDDVITTGATVDECARTLKAGGADWVGAYSFALAKHDN